MNSQLRFLSWLASALSPGARRDALEKAFERMLSLRHETRHEHGFRQFLQFLHAVRSEHRRILRGEGSSVIDDLISSFLERALGGNEAAQPVGQGASIQPQSGKPSEFESLCAGVRQATRRPETCAFNLVHEGRQVGRLWPKESGVQAVLSGLAPGSYGLGLETGRVVWESVLTERELVWASAFPGQPLTLAADSGGNQRRAARAFELLGGAVFLHVYPGVETGAIAITCRRQWS